MAYATGGSMAVLALAGALTGALPAGCEREREGTPGASASAQEGSWHTRRLTVSGLDRSYLVYVPRSYDPARPPPVILAFHGGFGSPRSFVRTTALHEPAGRAGYVVAFPEGYGRSWNAGDCCGPARRDGVDDVGFTRALLADLRAVVRYDSLRVFATGFSNGGKMAYRLACELSDQVAAIAPVGAAISVTDAECRPARAVPVQHIHGMLDEFGPFQGGASDYSRAGPQRSVPQTVRFWAQANGCTTADSTALGPAVTRKRYASCRSGAEVVLYTVGDLGHQWPGGREVNPRRLRAGSNRLLANRQILDFFSRHSLRP